MNYFVFCHCSYQKLGDLSTTLEMTVLFILSFRAKRSMSFRGHSMPEETPGTGLSPGKVIFPCRHFDQTKCVEKSPKAKQWLSFAKYQPHCHSEPKAKNLLQRTPYHDGITVYRKGFIWNKKNCNLTFLE